MTVISQSLKSELECHKNNSLVAQRRKKKQRKKVKGKFRLVTKKFPRLPAKVGSIKTERVRSALSIASYLWSWDLCIFSDRYALFCLHLLLCKEEVSLPSDFPLPQLSFFSESRLWRWKGSNPQMRMWETHQGGDSRQTSYCWWPPQFRGWGCFCVSPTSACTSILLR